MTDDEKKRETPAPKLGNAPVPFDAASCTEIADLVRERHGVYIRGDETVEIEGELGHGHAKVHCVLAKRDGTFELSVETCVECEPNDISSPIVARDAALDYLGLVLEEFFASERMLRFRPNWQEYEMGTTTVLMRGKLTNPFLEAEADRLLAEHGFDEDGHPDEP